MLSLNSLNPQQRLAVETLNGPVLILAGAGTGKTRVITYRIAHLISRQVAPGNILAVTFTNKAAREMRERVAKLLPHAQASRNPSHRPHHEAAGAPADFRPTICTFHSLCVRILRQHIERLGYKKNFVIYDESEQVGVMRKILSRISNRSEKIDPAVALAMLSRVKNGGNRAASAEDSDLGAMMQHLRQLYESALRACNAVDFDDLILLTLRLFEEHPEALNACRERFRYVMVDEYQDTNAAQFRLVHALTGQHRNLCVVGDDDQSIYGWRGAEISNLLDMEQHFPEVKVVKLEQNYRSTNTILNAANAIIQHNVRRRGKRLWSQQGEGARILLQAFSDDEAEARGIVEQIEYARLAQRIPWSDQAVLFRTNQQSRPIEMAFRQANVRYHLIGGQSFFDRREVRDLLAYLKMFVNPHDDVSLLRIANVPARGLSDVTMERLLGASQERNCSVFAVMQNPAVTATLQSKTRGSIESFVTWVERNRNQLTSANPTAAGASPDAFMQNWADGFLDQIGYFAEIQRLEKTAESAEFRIRGLKDLIATLGREPAITPMETLQNFLEKITLDNEREEEEENPGNAVTLITMHSCKGLEFPHVYVVGLEDGLLPHSRSKEEGTLDEERRLFYVAMTRAMKTLSISHCCGRKKYGKVMGCHPSPFLKELPLELIEDADEKARQPVAVESGRARFDVIRAALGES
jgi:superfamily I DNA/RNA helicase